MNRIRACESNSRLRRFGSKGGVIPGALPRAITFHAVGVKKDELSQTSGCCRDP
jgi:hypothetical protein